ncbi:MAG: thioredoxin-disulfide reductase [Candidatus ainarchaeum sp.]|nr:thioredoxin-disulfide reductase [Candidatus ainarchaeum sp.]
MYDVIIIGSGSAGLNASLYAARAGLKTLIIEKEPITGGQIALSSIVENWLGEKSISGSKLVEKFTEHVSSFGVEIKQFTEVISVELEGEVKKIKTSSEEFQSKVIVIATGSREKKLGISGEEEFKGKGVSYCALCDAGFFKGKEVAIIGGGNTALEESEYLSKFASKIYIIHRRNELKAEKIILEKAKKNKNLEFILNTTVSEITGNKQVEKIKLKNVETGKESFLDVSGVFVFVGMIPNSELFQNIKKDEHGYIISDEYMQTNVPGVFVAGDVRKQPINQLITAAADGAIAAVSAYKYLSEK